MVSKTVCLILCLIGLSQLASANLNQILNQVSLNAPFFPYIGHPGFLGVPTPSKLSKSIEPK